MDSILSTRNVSFSSICYPEIEIPTSKTTFIIGPSGCGKSTLLRLFNATLSPNSGEIFYKNTHTATLDILNLRKNVLLVQQMPYLFDGDVRDNFREYYHFAKESITEDKIRLFCKLCCVDFPLDRDALKLSGGQRQRVFLSIFVSFAREVLMLDEPSSALDNGVAREVVGQIKNYCKEKNITLIVVTHTPSLYEFADNLITLGKNE